MPLAAALDRATHGFIEVLSLGGAETPLLILLFPCRLLPPASLLAPHLPFLCYNASGRSSDLLSGLCSQVISSIVVAIRHMPVCPECVGHMPVSPGCIFQV